MKNTQSIKPLVSVLITSYNYSRFIGDAIKSVLEQDYSNIELIVADNNSSDDSLDVAMSFTNEARIKIIKRTSNVGFVENFRMALVHDVRGEYFLNVCADDYLVDRSLISKAMAIFESYDNVVVVKGRSSFVDRTGKHLRDDYDYRYFKGSFHSVAPVDGRQVFLKWADCGGLVGISGTVYRTRDLLIHALSAQREILFNGRCFYYDAMYTLKIILSGKVHFLDSIGYANRLHGENGTGHVTVGQVIDNVVHILGPKDYASDLGLFSNEELDGWAYRAMRRYYIDIQKHFYLYNRDAYDVVSSWLYSSFPVVHRSISESFNFRAYKIFCSVPGGSKIWPLLGHVKGRLQGRF